MPDATDLEGLCEDFLDACSASLDTLTPAYDGAPDRQFVSAGTPAADCCPQLTVHAQSVIDGAQSPLAPKAAQAKVNHVVLVATLFRCVSGGEESNGRFIPPAVSVMQAEGEQHHADGWALWNHLQNLVRAEQLFQVCGDVTNWILTSLEPSGGCGGWRLQVTVGLDGYEEAIST